LASDMGRRIQQWTAGPEPRTRLREFDDKARDTVFGPADPIPAPRARGDAQGDESPYTNSDGAAF
ncbi:MAG: hypothetical protein LBH65_05045, partial [Desulfovibrio sp.]|nr:hypothetical protein [Desulfovibrio sp.]